MYLQPITTRGPYTCPVRFGSRNAFYRAGSDPYFARLQSVLLPRHKCSTTHKCYDTLALQGSKSNSLRQQLCSLIRKCRDSCFFATHLMQQGHQKGLPLVKNVVASFYPTRVCAKNVFFFRRRPALTPTPLSACSTRDAIQPR